MLLHIREKRQQDKHGKNNENNDDYFFRLGIQHDKLTARRSFENKIAAVTTGGKLLVAGIRSQRNRNIALFLTAEMQPVFIVSGGKRVAYRVAVCGDHLARNAADRDLGRCILNLKDGFV